MSPLGLLVGFALATLGWQLVARAAGPPLAQKLYGHRVTRIKLKGMVFADQEAMDVWASSAARSSMNAALLLLAVLCGAAAGAFNIPLVGFSRSMNGWSWLRMLTLCGTSWLVAAALHPSSF